MGSCNLISCLLFFLSPRQRLSKSHWQKSPVWTNMKKHFCIEMCPQILPSSDTKAELERTLLCILNYKSCNLHGSDNNSQLMWKRFSSLQAIPLKKKIEEQPLAPIIAPSTPLVAWHTLGLLGEGGVPRFWVENKTDCEINSIPLGCKSNPLQQQESATLIVSPLNQSSFYFIHSLCS